MANINNSLAAVMHLPGIIGVSIADVATGVGLAQIGRETFDLDTAVAGNTGVVRALVRALSALNLHDGLEDVLITLGSQYHIIRPLLGKGSAGLFMYVALNREEFNLAYSRHKINEICKVLTL